MVVNPHQAAPPNPWSVGMAEPNIDSSAYVHSFSNLIGNVVVGPNVLISPGTSIRANEGFPFYIGRGSNIQDGVVIHGLEKGKVRGDDGKEYSVWIGEETCITHMALIHGPAYIGNQCFIGFRSTVFNAKVGHGCVVMMHALIQDVEIPPGKYVPSGAIITNQQQADRLPDVQESDRAFVQHVVEINEALLAGYQCAESSPSINPIQDSLKDSPPSHSETTMSLDSSIRDQVRALVSQGYKISTEHANKRRFATKSWLTNPIIEGHGEQQIISALQQTLQQYQGEYVRLVGIDSSQRKRVAEIIIQRPDGSTPVPSGTQKIAINNSVGTNSQGNGKGSEDLGTQIRAALNQGYKLTVERASKRRFKTSSWLTVGAVDARNAQKATTTINGLISQYPTEFIRIITINPKSKTRVAETIVHRPDGSKASRSNGGGSASFASTGFSGNGTSGLDANAVQQVSSLLSQGYKIGTEHATVRRFKTKSWQSCGTIDSTNPNEVVRALENCIQEHAGEYVRMIGIDTKARRRVYEGIIQRPGNKPVASTSSSNGAFSTSNVSSNSFSSNNYSSSGASRLDAQVKEQVGSLLSQGYQIGTEHANKRRFKTKSWQSCSPIDSNSHGEVIQELERCLSDHTGEYVRLIGIDTQAKRRVLETIIQRP